MTIYFNPIETAPKDGTDILLFEKYNEIPFIGYWSATRKRWYANAYNFDTDGNACVVCSAEDGEIVGWFPIPVAPK